MATVFAEQINEIEVAIAELTEKLNSYKLQKEEFLHKEQKFETVVGQVKEIAQTWSGKALEVFKNAIGEILEGRRQEADGRREDVENAIGTEFGKEENLPAALKEEDIAFSQSSLLPSEQSEVEPTRSPYVFVSDSGEEVDLHCENTILIKRWSNYLEKWMPNVCIDKGNSRIKITGTTPEQAGCLIGNFYPSSPPPTHNIFEAPTGQRRDEQRAEGRRQLLEEDSNSHSSPTSKFDAVQGDSNPKSSLLPSAFDHLPDVRSEVEMKVESLVAKTLDVTKEEKEPAASKADVASSQSNPLPSTDPLIGKYARYKGNVYEIASPESKGRYLCRKYNYNQDTSLSGWDDEVLLGKDLNIVGEDMQKYFTERIKKLKREYAEKNGAIAS